TPPAAAHRRARGGDRRAASGGRCGFAPHPPPPPTQRAHRARLPGAQTRRPPPAPPVTFAITPATTTPGRSVHFELGGAKKSENVTFRIDSPTGSFTGPPHAAAEDGTVSTTYTPPLDATPGMYAVVVSGDQGTAAQAACEVEPSPVR